MTADFKALCEELCDLLDQIDLSIFRRAGIFREVQTRARAALEAPPAPVVGDDDLRGVFYDHCDYDDDASWIESEQFIVAVRAVLAKCGTTPAPVPVPGAADDITDDQGRRWNQTMDAALWAKAFCATFPGSDEDLMLAWFANAIMAGWDHHGWKMDQEARPVPVSERLPAPEDCDAEGRCWWWMQLEDGRRAWLLRPQLLVPALASIAVPRRTHWLPAHALPLPEVGP